MSSKNYFDSVADKWDEIRKSFFPNGVRVKAVEAADIKAGKIAADIGAGTGFLTEILLEKGLKVIAIDQSEEMLEKIERKFCCNPNLVTAPGTDKKLPLQDSQIDYAFANMFLHHVENPLTAIKEMTRILKPGGKLIVTDLDEHNFDFLVTEQHDVWMGFNRKDIESWFKQAGLHNVRVNCVGKDCCSTSNNGTEEAKISIFIASGDKPQLEGEL